jgi:MoaA/NifB/PqqE/SkfB family radical SAM enzyme
MKTAQWTSLVSAPFTKPKIAFVAVTNKCHHRCVTCDIWAQPPIEIPIERLKQAIDRLHDFGVRLILFTGGETTLYKAMPEAIAHASSRGIFSQLPTNGHRLTPERARAYRQAGLVGLGISMEHHDAQVLEKNRGHVGVKQAILGSLESAKAAGLAVSAYVLISRLNLGALPEIAEHHAAAGFDGINFCYPMTDMGSTFELGGLRTGDPAAADLSPEELTRELRVVQALREKGPIFVYNPAESLELALDHLEGRPVRFPCLGGSRIFWLDWKLDLYLCPKKSVNLGNILNLKELPREATCNQCLFQGYRDLSIYLQGLNSVGPLMRLARDHLQGAKFK